MNVSPLLFRNIVNHYGLHFSRRLQMALIPPFFFDCVTAIGFADDSGKINYSATGFLIGKLVTPPPPQSPIHYVYLVTNRHVFDGSKEATLRFNPAAGNPAKEFQLSLVSQIGAPLYAQHPDSEIDIAVTSINLTVLRQQGIQYAFFSDNNHVLTLRGHSPATTSEGDAVFILGFPMGDVGKDRNYVVSRKGSIARIRDTISGSSKYFLVDATIFPGNSGSPVVTKQESMAIQGTKAIPAANLLGIVAAYLPYTDVAISAQTKRPRIVFEENSGLAIVFPVDSIMDVVNATYAAQLAAQVALTTPPPVSAPP